MSADFGDRAVLLDDARRIPGRATLFTRPLDWIVCDEPGDVPRTFDRIERALARGHWVAGAFAYELGYALEPHLAALMPRDRRDPLIAVGVYAPPQRLDGGAAEDFVRAFADRDCRVEGVEAAWDLGTYLAAFDRVKRYIEAGDVYQINLTFPLSFRVEGDPLALYPALRMKARAGFGAAMRDGARTILSLSPELFVESDGKTILTRPMKGTVARAPGAEEDRVRARQLTQDEKQRAENLMIVDLLRNDLSRIAEKGSVEVSDLFTPETFPTLHAMTSGVTARLQQGLKASDILRAIFPCGSVTGAPKIRAMEIIRELEPSSRGVYCGAIGAFGPGGEILLNVAIRTAVIEGRVGRMGIGSGLVYDSDGAGEYEECLLKSRFLTQKFEPFDLIETLRWTSGGGYFLLERHLARLEASAAYFEFACDRSVVRAALDDAARGFAHEVMRVRLLLSVDGKVTIASVPLTPPFASGGGGDDARRPLTFVVSATRISSSDPFVRHKTTRRALYDGEWARLTRERGCDEVLFLNERGELAEGSRTNIFVERGGVLLTPPLGAGCLDGCLRRELLETGRAVEAALTPADLGGAVFLGNSLRGLQGARLVTESPKS